jgi:hypothetical protein
VLLELFDYSLVYLQRHEIKEAPTIEFETYSQDRFDEIRKKYLNDSPIMISFFKRSIKLKYCHIFTSKFKDSIIDEFILETDDVLIEKIAFQNLENCDLEYKEIFEESEDSDVEESEDSDVEESEDSDVEESVDIESEESEFFGDPAILAIKNLVNGFDDNDKYGPIVSEIADMGYRKPIERTEIKKWIKLLDYPPIDKDSKNNFYEYVSQISSYYSPLCAFGLIIDLVWLGWKEQRSSENTVLVFQKYSYPYTGLQKKLTQLYDECDDGFVKVHISTSSIHLSDKRVEIIRYRYPVFISWLRTNNNEFMGAFNIHEPMNVHFRNHILRCVSFERMLKKGIHSFFENHSSIF